MKRRVDGVMRASFDAESALTTARRSCGSMGVCRALAAISTARKAIAWKGTGISHHKSSMLHSFGVLTVPNMHAGLDRTAPVVYITRREAS